MLLQASTTEQQALSKIGAADIVRKVVVKAEYPLVSEGSSLFRVRRTLGVWCIPWDT